MPASISGPSNGPDGAGLRCAVVTRGLGRGQVEVVEDLVLAMAAWGGSLSHGHATSEARSER